MWLSDEQLRTLALQCVCVCVNEYVYSFPSICIGVCVRMFSVQRPCPRVFSRLPGSARAIYSFHSAHSGLWSKITDKKSKHQADPTHELHTLNPFSYP